ncbi:M15 family metallopeptidase [Streptomyces sp. NPDC058646]|uniref:M15 family metallopeptidase n=1 Tax=Streptomyces sp. NPDC058646 TaxID=3346574 RepID=UPI003663F88C
MRLASPAVAAVVVLCTATVACTSASAPPPPVPSAALVRAPGDRLAAEVERVSAAVLGPTYRPGCPVGPERLRLIRMNHWGFDGTVHRGELVVHERAVRPLLQVFGKMFEAKFPLRRMRPVAAYGGDDARSMADDNTSAFNCRQVTGDGARRSRHAYGDAVDIGPLENPYVDRRGTVRPPAGRAHLRRDRPVPGMIRQGDAVTRAFEEVGWHWGGRWSNPDYQHFSATGG